MVWTGEAGYDSPTTQLQEQFGGWKGNFVDCGLAEVVDGRMSRKGSSFQGEFFRLTPRGMEMYREDREAITRFFANVREYSKADIMAELSGHGNAPIEKYFS